MIHNQGKSKNKINMRNKANVINTNPPTSDYSFGF